MNPRANNSDLSAKLVRDVGASVPEPEISGVAQNTNAPTPVPAIESKPNETAPPIPITPDPADFADDRNREALLRRAEKDHLIHLQRWHKE